MAKFSFLLISVFLCLAQKIDAQETITGRVIDEFSNPVAFANVIMHSLEDSTYIDGTITKEDGTFLIEKKVAKSFLKISCIGFKTTNYNVLQNSLGDILLYQDSNILGEVVVHGNIPKYVLNSEGMSINVHNTLLRQAGTADNVLSQLPRVSGGNGSYTVFGKGAPVIYIDNRKIINTSELSQLKSSDIKEVEVITNPGAQYGSDVQSVIRIKTIKPIGNGWSISSYSFANFSRKFSPIESLNLKYHQNKWEFFGDFRIQSLHNKQYSEFVQTLYGVNEIQETGRDTIFNNGDKQIRGQIGFNYEINRNHSWGINYGITRSLNDVIHSVSSLDFSIDNSVDERIKMKSAYTSYHIPDHEFNIYYIGKIGDLGIDFNGTYYNSNQTRTQCKDEDNSLFGHQTVDVENTTNNSMYAGKLIFSYPLFTGKLSLGSEYIDTESSGSNTNKQQIFDNTETRIKERNIAGFAEYNIPFKDFRARTGIRYEHVISDYYSNDFLQSDPCRKYSDWFPSLSLSWSKGKWQAQIGYNAKMLRPSYRNLSSWMQYDNRYEYQGGNPLLKPAQVHTVEMTATRTWLTFTLGYKNTKNQVAYVMHPYEGNIFIKTYENIDNIQSLYASLTASPRFGIYQPMYEANISKQFLEDNIYGIGVSLGHPRISFRMNNRFAITKDFTVSVNLSYNSSYASTISVYKEGGSLDVNVYKSFFNNKLVFHIWGRDLLQTQKMRYTMYSINSMFSTKQDIDSRCFSIGLQYNFNASKSKYKGTGAGNSEKGRM